MLEKNKGKMCINIVIAIFAVFGTLTMTAYAAEIHGMTWNDANGNGTIDNGEVGMEGVTICYYSYSDSIPYPGICTTTTGIDGNYVISDLASDRYIISEIVPPGKVQTYPLPCSQTTMNCSLIAGIHDVTVASGDIVNNINFGYSDSSEIHGMKFNDSNGNGVKDIGELGVPDILINLRRIISPGNERFADYEITDMNGEYSFTGISAGYYKVDETPIWGISQTYPAAGAPYLITLGVGDVKTGVDFGNFQLPPGTVTGTGFNDTNGNGVQDADEKGIEGITISLPRSGRTDVTDMNGNYIFDNVPVGPLEIYENLPDGYVATTPIYFNGILTTGNTLVANFGSRKLTPPPSDVSIVQQSGTTTNGVPTIMRPGLSILTIQKNLSWVTEGIAAVSLTLKWTDGTTKIESMAYNIATGNWEANLVSPFPPGSAEMTFNVDVNPPGVTDFVEIGDIIFLDPSGQIRNSCSNQPVKGAIVTLYLEFPPGSFIKSPTGYQIPNDNPQTTLEDGYYRWDVRSFNTYKVGVTKTGFVPNESEPVVVPPPRTGLDILMTPTGGCSNIFTGFFPPVENPPTLNKVKAGSAIPLKFSLGGYRGLDIFDIDYPKSSVISCAGTIDTIGDDETVTAVRSELSYNQAIDQYNYIWKTENKWTGCRQLVLKFNDGTYHRANFAFSK